MAIKVYTLEGTIPANSAETELDTLTTPSGFKRALQEVRVYTQGTTGIKVRLYKETDYLAEFNAENVNLLKLPYTVTEELGSGTTIRMTAINSSSSDSVVKVEIVVDETTA